jgi:stearoyl-CoA desaturase (delta-9 desaturase)
VTADAITLQRRTQPNWRIVILLVAFHLGAIGALFLFTWRSLAVTILLYWMTIGLGISLGYHRLHTHRSYVVPLPVEYFFAVCGTLTLQGGPMYWVATHRIHHHKPDQPGDPHSPREGAWWAHLGWIVFGGANHKNTAMINRLAPDLAKHRFYVWLTRYHWVPTLVLAAILFAWGGIGMVLWGICLRVVVGLHSTWLVNSGTHMWGRRRFDTIDDSRNNWWIALLTFGEGWHNNHHAHPTSARHGLAWYEFDSSWILLRVLESMGVARSVRVAKLTDASVS